MFLFFFGWTGIRVELKHEFNLRDMPKFWCISFLFFQILYLNKTNEKSVFDLFSKYAWSDHDLDWHPRVRLAVAKAEKRAISEYKVQMQSEIDSYKLRCSSSEAKLQQANEQLVLLRMTIKGLHLLQSEEIQLQEVDNSIPQSILEATR